MEKESCLNCKFVSYVIENKQNPMRSIFYCTWREQIFANCEVCGFYHEKSSNKQ